MESKTIVVKNKDLLFKVHLSEILYCRASGSYSLIKTNEEEFSIAKNLSTLEKLIESDSFLRISRFYLVNMDYCTCIDTSSRKLLLKNNEEIQTSVRCFSKVLKTFKAYN